MLTGVLDGYADCCFEYMPCGRAGRFALLNAFIWFATVINIAALGPTAG